MINNAHPAILRKIENIPNFKAKILASLSSHSLLSSINQYIIIIDNNNKIHDKIIINKDIIISFFSKDYNLALPESLVIIL